MAASIVEGSAYSFPLRDGSQGLAIVARRTPRGRIVALYLFYPAPAVALDGRTFDLPRPETSVFRGRFSDYALRDGSWSHLGVHPHFDRTDWPFNRVAFRNLNSRRPWLALTLDDEDPNRVIGQEVVSEGEALALPQDVLLAPEGMDRYVSARLDNR